MTTETLAPPALLPRLAEATAGVVVCLATGPSLTAADVDYVRGKATVVAVNDAHRLAPWADVLYSSDRYWWKYYRGVRSFQGRKVGIEHTVGRFDLELRHAVPGITIFRCTGHDGVELEPTGLRTCRQNSGGAAVNLAVHLGARRIVLLGYDMGDTTGQGHFFGKHPTGLSQMHHFPKWRQGFDLMAPEFAAAGIDVINCSRTTSLSAFRLATIAEVLP